MSVDNKTVSDFMLMLEKARETKTGLSHYEFRILHAYCLGVIERKVKTVSLEWTKLYCPIHNISSAIE